MNRLDRALGILLLLRGGKGVSAATLARRFEVSPRTIYRDVETLSALGVPVYAVRGRAGGFRLLEGYFLPPVTFTQGEALALVVGLSLLGSLRSKPFAADLETARDKLVAAVPEALRAILLHLHQHIGFEELQEDVFHPERPAPEAIARQAAAREAVVGEGESEEGEAVGAFVRGMVGRTALLVRYRSPYRGETETHVVAPLGAFWDRGYWYLVGSEVDPVDTVPLPRLWRADRVLSIRLQAWPVEPAAEAFASFDVHTYLGRRWLASAMQHWAEEAPVRIRLTQRQAERLRRDWYFRHARFEPLETGELLMTFGELDQESVLELLRWLGPGAELLEPASWRAALATQLVQMLARYR
jgi:predicted DNA-binding transcriptional regulator YafY